MGAEALESFPETSLMGAEALESFPETSLMGASLRELFFGFTLVCLEVSEPRAEARKTFSGFEKTCEPVHLEEDAEVLFSETFSVVARAEAGSGERERADSDVAEDFFDSIALIKSPFWTGFNPTVVRVSRTSDSVNFVRVSIENIPALIRLVAMSLQPSLVLILIFASSVASVCCCIKS
jgi:hypothetical protein